MVKRVLTKEDVVDELTIRTGFFKSSIREMLSVLEDVVFENMITAELNDPSEIHFMRGITIGAKVRPACKHSHPSTGEMIDVPERIVPYLKDTRHFRDKMNTAYSGGALDE